MTRTRAAAHSCALILTIAIAATNLMAQKDDRTKPPQTPPLPDFKLPPLVESKLPNGLAIVLVEDHRFPLVTVRLGFQAGAKYDPKDLPGLSEMTGALLTEGTGTRSSRQLAEELAGIGGALKAQSGGDAMTIAGSALSDHLGQLLDLLADVARHANFPADEVQLRKQNRKQELLAELSQSSTVADKKLSEVVFGDNPYSHTLPTPESIDKMRREDMAGFRDRYLAPNDAVLILLGAIPPAKETVKMIAARFSDWPRKQAPAAASAPIPEPKRTVVLVDRPGSVQADVRIAKLAITRAHPDYFPLAVANSILGGGGNSRLFLEIREKKGYAYDAHSEVRARKDAGFFTAVSQVRNEVLEPALDDMLREMTTLAKEPVAAADLQDVKNFMSGVFVLRLETQSGLADQLSLVKLMGLNNDYLEKYTARVRSVDPAQIQSVAQKYIDPAAADIVVVGDASKIAKPLEKYGEVSVEKAK
jgi:predicted Zn-dependent peptidase